MAEIRNPQSAIRNSSRTGTREWSEHSVNWQFGCRHGCIYCYAREQAIRFKRLKPGADWREERITPVRSAVMPKYDGVVMCPTTHDLTEGNTARSAEVLAGLLNAGNRVLLVTKCGPDVLRAVVDFMPPLRRSGSWAGLLELRVSITHLSERLRAIWEPGAPTAQERYDTLKLAASLHLATSVSVEPLLEPARLEELIDFVAPYVVAKTPAAGPPEFGGTIWIGRCNNLRRRTIWRVDELAGRPDESPDRRQQREQLHREIDALEAQQTDEAVLRVARRLKDGGYLEPGGRPAIRWKDSYRQVIEQSGGI